MWTEGVPLVQVTGVHSEPGGNPHRLQTPTAWGAWDGASPRGAAVPKSLSARNAAVERRNLITVCRYGAARRSGTEEGAAGAAGWGER